MKCDRCKDDHSARDMNSARAKELKPEFGYKDLIAGGKLKFCDGCWPVVLLDIHKQPRKVTK